jgi:UDP-3-O-[3-hydroxymyristoyl] glucosamine N-acyltransferase
LVGVSVLDGVTVGPGVGVRDGVLVGRVGEGVSVGPGVFDGARVLVGGGGTLVARKMLPGGCWPGSVPPPPRVEQPIVKRVPLN